MPATYPLLFSGVGSFALWFFERSSWSVISVMSVGVVLGLALLPNGEALGMCLATLHPCGFTLLLVLSSGVGSFALWFFWRSRSFSYVMFVGIVLGLTLAPNGEVLGTCLRLTSV